MFNQIFSKKVVVPFFQFVGIIAIFTFIVFPGLTAADTIVNIFSSIIGFFTMLALFYFVTNWFQKDELTDEQIKEKYQKLNEEIENTKLKRLKEVAEIELACHRQLAQYEHDFHSTKEERGIELAKLEAKAEMLREGLENNSTTAIIAAKDAEINRLVNVINSLTKIKTK